MPIVSAFLVPSSPLPYVKRDNKPWGKIAAGLESAGVALSRSKPDVILLYSTQWIAVLDQLWQVKPRVSGIHVDENWHEYGELPYKLRIDTRLARACLAATSKIGVRSKPVNYDGFPIDTGTIVATNFLNPGGTIPCVLTSNNLYHDFELTKKLGRLATGLALAQKKRVSVVGVGNFSDTFFRHKIDIRKDKISSQKYNRWNKKILSMMESGNVDSLTAALPAFISQAKAEMGFKHAAWVLGALRGKFKGAHIHAYGPLYGSGGAVVEFILK